MTSYIRNGNGRILVGGGRNYSDHKTLYAILDHFQRVLRFTAVVEGGAWGADHLARQWCDNRGVQVFTVWANWTGNGKAAGPLRNELALDIFNPDEVILFPGGKGTDDMRQRATRRGTRVIEAERFDDLI